MIDYYKKMAIVTHSSLHSKRIMNRQERLYPLVLPESREKFTKISEEVTHELGFKELK